MTWFVSARGGSQRRWIRVAVLFVPVGAALLGACRIAPQTNTRDQTSTVTNQRPAPVATVPRTQPALLTTTLSVDAFSPAQLRGAPGAFELRVNNLSEQPVVMLELRDAHGARLSEARVSNKVHAWIGKFDLAAGSYELVATGRPNRVCRITLAAQ